MLGGSPPTSARCASGSASCRSSSASTAISRSTRTCASSRASSACRARPTARRAERLLGITRLGAVPRPARRRPLRRHVQEARAGLRAAARAGGAAARRADQRRRPGEAARAVGAALRVRRTAGWPCWSRPRTWTRPRAATASGCVHRGRLLAEGDARRAASRDFDDEVVEVRGGDRDARGRRARPDARRCAPPPRRARGCGSWWPAAGRRGGGAARAARRRARAACRPTSRTSSSRASREAA